jgi:hypothetical protein
VRDNYHRLRPKSNQKLVSLPARPPQPLRLGGMEPSEDMQPGVYRVSCQSAAVEHGRVVIHYQVIDGPHTGTALRQWIATPTSGQISPKSRYAQQCSIALGRSLDASDNVNNPTTIFAGKFFSVEVGFRKTDRPRGGRFSEENALHRKDTDDGLRVHAVLAREEL